MNYTGKSLVTKKQQSPSKIDIAMVNDILKMQWLMILDVKMVNHYFPSTCNGLNYIISHYIGYC